MHRRLNTFVLKEKKHFFGNIFQFVLRKVNQNSEDSCDDAKKPGLGINPQIFLWYQLIKNCWQGWSFKKKCCLGYCISFDISVFANTISQRLEMILVVTVVFRIAQRCYDHGSF